MKKELHLVVMLLGFSILLFLFYSGGLLVMRVESLFAIGDKSVPQGIVLFNSFGILV